MVLLVTITIPACRAYDLPQCIFEDSTCPVMLGGHTNACAGEEICHLVLCRVTVIRFTQVPGSHYAELVS